MRGVCLVVVMEEILGEGRWRPTGLLYDLVVPRSVSFRVVVFAPFFVSSFSRKEEAGARA